jgi:hypothetical protein
MCPALWHVIFEMWYMNMYYSLCTCTLHYLLQSWLCTSDDVLMATGADYLRGSVSLRAMLQTLQKWKVVIRSCQRF